jgi:hypothetical protein
VKTVLQLVSNGVAGFDTSKGYTFEPFTPHLAEPLGAFHSFAG